MGRRMWPYEAEMKFNVRATYEQAGKWEYAARIYGLPTPVFLARAADDFASAWRSGTLARIDARPGRRSREGCQLPRQSHSGTSNRMATGGLRGRSPVGRNVARRSGGLLT